MTFPCFTADCHCHCHCHFYGYRDFYRHCDFHCDFGFNGVLRN
jgi:hypothetical protein